MGKRNIELPPCGIFIGTGIYAMSADYLLSTLYGHQQWAPQSFSPLEMIEKVIEDNQGNLVQFWGHARGQAPATIAEWFYALDEIGIHVPKPDWKNGRYLTVQDCPELKRHADRLGAGALRFIKAAAERGLYTVLLYVDAERKWSERFHEVGEYYLGYDYGERYSGNFRSDLLGSRSPDEITLSALAQNLIARVREHVEERHASGWGCVMTTSGAFHVDYEILAGTDIPVIEDFAFCHLNLASSLARGLYRQHDLPLWGSHLAHEHYSWIPFANRHKFDLLRAAMYQKYMAGSKMIINESGGWFVESTLCEDSPHHQFPRVHLPHSRLRKEPHLFAPFIEEARKHYHKINYDSAWCRRYREVISDFYDFVKSSGTPTGQPETTVAVAKGNLDLCHPRFMPNSAVGGAYAVADRHPEWFEGPPERGWEIVRRVFYPLPPVLAPHPNHFLSGTPYGMVDIVSFALDRISARFLSENYKALLFCGWNTASEKQYDILTRYVSDGGRLFISIPHLSKNVRRNYTSYGVDELVNGGDFSELCGVRVKGPGERFHWATAPESESEIGFRFPRRFGIMAVPMGNIEITDPAVRILVVDDEDKRPLLLRRKCGKGEVFFLNSWAYPGALDVDDGPGATLDSKGLIALLYGYIATLSRGHVWITDDRASPGSECEYTCYSYFPDAGRICLLNVDFERSHRFFLHHFGAVECTELGPGEFRMLDTARVEASSQPAV